VIDRRVALLRGINVGTAKRVAMADLRRLFEDLGYGDARTLLNSGNVVFTAVKKRGADDGERIEKAIADRLGVTTRVTVLLGNEVAEAVKENPLGPIADNRKPWRSGSASRTSGARTASSAVASWPRRTASSATRGRRETWPR
jgi:uncharacterized protein (DUF1697 family)